MSPMDALIRYAFCFVGKPYIYGDKSPVVGGYDCSGYVCEILRFAGLVGYNEHLNSQMLFNRFQQTGTEGVLGPGVLAFYGQSVTKITHVAFMLNSFQILEAGGGDSTTDTAEKADSRMGMVRGRLVDYRKDRVATVKPRYAPIGVI